MIATDVKTPGSSVIPAHWISPGFSFRNPSVGYTVTTPRRIPWFMSQTWKPLPINISPAWGSNNLWGQKRLLVAKPYWRRKYKNNVLRRIDHAWNEIPSYEEEGLGQLATMTEPSVPVSERGLWGNLTSILTAAGSTWQNIQQTKFEQKAAVERSRIENEFNLRREIEGIGGIKIGAVVIAGLAGVYFLTRG